MPSSSPLDLPALDFGVCPVCDQPVEFASFLPDVDGFELPCVCRRHLPPAWLDRRLNIEARHVLAGEIACRLGYVRPAASGHGRGNVAPGYTEYRRDRHKRRRRRRSGELRRWVRKRLTRMVGVVLTLLWLSTFVGEAVVDHLFHREH